jgi:hypothetical protein
VPITWTRHEAERIKVGLNRVGHRGDGRTLGERRGSSVSRKVGSDHFVLGVEARAERGEVVVRAADAVQEHSVHQCPHGPRTDETSPVRESARRPGGRD